MTEAERMAQRIQQTLPGLKRGTLRLWGQWFGRPYDNTHSVVDCAAAGDLLRVTFDQGEVLSVSEPADAHFSESVFRIRRASRVRWEWFYYGRPKTAANLYYEEYSSAGPTISARTNVDWYLPDLEPDPADPAVEIV
jgi:hypothetical protein